MGPEMRATFACHMFACSEKRRKLQRFCLLSFRCISCLSFTLMANLTLISIGCPQSAPKTLSITLTYYPSTHTHTDTHTYTHTHTHTHTNTTHTYTHTLSLSLSAVGELVQRCGGVGPDWQGCSPLRLGLSLPL